MDDDELVEERPQVPEHGFECLRLDDCPRCKVLGWLWRIVDKDGNPFAAYKIGCQKCIRIEFEKLEGAGREKISRNSDTCVNGHTGDWYYSPRKGYRQCRSCRKQWQEQYKKAI